MDIDHKLTLTFCRPSCGVNATDLFDRDDDDYDPDWSFIPPIEVSSMTISQAIDAPLSSKESASLSGTLSVQNGRGNGNVAVTLRRIISDKTWMELQIAVGQGPLITVKGFRTISKRGFCTANTFLHFGRGGINPGIEIGICTIIYTFQQIIHLYFCHISDRKAIG